MSESVQGKKPVNSCQFTTIFILKTIHGFRNFHLAGKLEKQAGKLSLLSLSAHAPPPKGRKGWGQIDTNYWTFQSVLFSGNNQCVVQCTYLHGGIEIKDLHGNISFFYTYRQVHPPSELTKLICQVNTTSNLRSATADPTHKKYHI